MSGDPPNRHKDPATSSLNPLLKRWRHICRAKIPVKSFRNKVLAHNDFDSFKDPLKVGTKLELEQIEDLRGLFLDSWRLMTQARTLITGNSTIEPNFGKLELFPTRVFHYLKYGLFHFQGNKSWGEFEYAEVGTERPISLVDNN